MRSHLNCSISSPDAGVLRWVASLGFNGTRQDFRLKHDWSHIRMVLQTYQQVPELTSPLFLLPFEEDEPDINTMLDFTETMANMIADYGFDRPEVGLEFCNEPNIFSDLWRANPEQLGEIFCSAIPRIRKWAKNITILTPSVSNLSQTEQGYAQRLFTPIKKKASDYAIAFHRYPAGMSHRAHDGFTDRTGEFGAFVAKVYDGAPGRQFWLTETGYSQVHLRNRPFPFCFTKEPVHIDEAEQLQYAAWEYSWWRMNTNVAAVTWYQINDGPDPNEPLDHYGIRRVDMTPKVIAEGFKMINTAIQ